MKKLIFIVLILFSIQINAQTIYTQAFSGVRQYAGLTNQANLEVQFANNNSSLQIKNPLIVVEGFDSGIMGVENEFGENSLLDFLRQVNQNGGFNLPAQVNTFDIIYINWKNGKDDMHRNAYLLEDIIKWVNTQKANAGSTTANVVLGQSMGGVIARYALKDMENQLASTSSQIWNHKTSLYISHDAPQQGANIPLGIQYFARHIIDQLVSTPLNDININPQDGATVTIDDIKTLLDATGTKQLLTKTVTSGFVVDDASSTAWQTELRNLGYPQQTRNIAISNGNHCANPQAFAPASVLFSLTGIGKTSPLTDMLAMLLQPVANVGFTWAAIKFNEPGLMLGFLPGNSKMDMDFKAKALPTTGTTTEIYKGKITFTKKFLWFSITSALTDRSYNNPSGILSYDYYPGGKYNVPFSFQNSSASNLLLSYGISAVIADNFDFIPTPSALDIGGGNVVLTDADYLKKYSSASPPLFPKNSPFVNFTTSFPNGANINENHISFNTRNGNWLATELDNVANNSQVFDCTYICSDAQISGADRICTSAVYSVPTTANWTITQGSSLVTLTGNGTKNITLTRVGSASGNVTMQANVGSSTCGYVTLTKTVWVGVPDFYVQVVSNGNYANFKNIYLNSNIIDIASQGIISVTWQKISGTGNIYASTSNNYQAEAYGPSGLNLDAKVTVITSCGTVVKNFHVEYVSNGGDPCDEVLISDQNMISIIKCDDLIMSKTSTSNTSQASKIEVFNFSGLKISSAVNSNYMDITNLPSGIYIIKVLMEDGRIITKKIRK